MTTSAQAPRWRRPFWLVLAALAVIVTGLGIAAGVSGAPDSAPVAIQSSTSAAAPVVAEPAPSTAEPSSATPTPAWTPCSTDVLDEDCADMMADSCDGAYAEHEDAGEPGLIDAFIENKDYVDEGRLKDCPQFLPAWRNAKTGFAEGSLEVGKDVKPGTYETTGGVSNCYWERGGKNGHTIANDFVTAAKSLTVTIHKSDEMFTTRGCGDWVRAG